jgi:hypothetical protein
MWEAVMAEYVWQHDLKGEADRLRLMSDLLDPSSEFHLLRIGATTGWRCLEIGAGNGSLSQWLAQRIGPAGHVIASDIRTDLMDGIAGGNLEVRRFDVVHDEPPDARGFGSTPWNAAVRSAWIRLIYSASPPLNANRGPKLSKL